VAKILGISCYYHDSAAALLHDGRIAAAAEEERFTRRKHDTAFPFHAVDFCLHRAGLVLEELDAVAFYEKPLAKFRRVLATHAAWFPRSLPAFLRSMPRWQGRSLLIPWVLRRHLGYGGPICFVDHHLSHAASAACFAPAEESAVLTVDGTGEWSTTTIGRRRGGPPETLAEIRYPHSLGLLYSTITSWLGFPVNEGEGRVMGLAAYGEPGLASEFDQLIRFDGDGGFTLDMDYFSFAWSDRRMFSRRLVSLLGEPRDPDGPIEDRHRAVAATLQATLERGLLGLAAEAARRSGISGTLALAGGVALNCLANGRLLRESPFDRLFVQPAAGDSGAALGAAAVTHHSLFPDQPIEPMTTARLGPDYRQQEVAGFLEQRGERFEVLEEEALLRRTAGLLADNRTVGWFQGRMEFGPRALGSRSILASPVDPGMKDRLNKRVKGREPFRPFAPAVPESRASHWFQLTGPSPFMILACQVRPEVAERIPAVVHQDGSARVQTVSPEEAPRFHRLLEAFGEISGVPVLLNTSFNLRGEPIVCNPAQALEDFHRCGLDALVINDCLLVKDGKEPAG